MEIGAASFQFPFRFLVSPCRPHRLGLPLLRARQYGPWRSPLMERLSLREKHLALLFVGGKVQSEILRSAPLRSE